MPLLDTSFLIRLQARDEAAIDLLGGLSGEPLLVPPWVVVEFLTGHTSKSERALEDLACSFTLVQTSPEWAIEASRFRRKLHAKGAKIRLADLWIATFARLHDTAVVTQDVKHFRALGVKTRTW